MAWTRLKRLIRPQQVHSDAGESTAAQTARWLVLALAGGLWGSGAYAATNYDLLVNHDAFRFGGLETTEIDAVDAPVGGIFVYRTKSKINGGSGTVSNATLTQRLPATAIFQGIDLPGGVSCTGQPSVGQAIGSNVITCTIGTLTTTEVHVDFKVLIPDDGTEHLAKATITEVGNTDLNPNNSDNIERNITTYKRADLAIAFAAPAANSTHQQGTVVNYQIQVNNTNNEYAFPLNAGEKAVVRFSQPTGTTFQSSPSSPGNAWSCVAGTDTSVMPNVPVYDCTYIAATAIAKNTTLPLITLPVVVAADSGNTTALASVAGQTTGSVNFVDAYTANNTTSVVIKFTPNDQLDMKLAKTVSPAVVDSQAASPVEVTYTLKATRNSGLLIPQGITITDTLPANVSFAAAVTPTDWVCTGSSGQTVTCTFDNSATKLANLPDLKFKAQVAVGSVALTDGQAVIKNTAVLAVDNEPVAGANNTSSADLTVTNQIALVTSKAASVGTGPIADGAEFFYTIEVKNDSSIAVQSGQAITVIDVLDGKLEYKGTDAPWSCVAVPAIWTDSTPQTVTCTLSAGIAAKGTNNLKLKVKANLDVGQWAQIANKASVSCPTGRVCPGHTDGVIFTNEHKINLSDLQADLSITKAAAITSGFSYGDGVSGSEVVYTLKVKNAVPFGQLPAIFQTAQTVVVTDTVTNLLNSNVSPAAHPVTGTPRYSNHRFIEAAVDGSSLPAGMSVEACTYSGSGSVTVTCTLKNVPVSDQEYTITIKARQYVDPTSSADQTGKITNTASVTSPDTAEFDAGNNTETAEVTLTALTNLTAQMQALPDTGVLAGQKINYTLSASNQGPSKATEVKVEDTLPLGMVWVTAPEFSSSAGTCTLANGDAIGAGLVVTAANQLMTCAWTGANATFAATATKSITYALRSANTGYPASVTSNAVARTTTQETIAWDAVDTDNTTSKVVTLAQPKLNVLINMGHSKDGLPINNGTTSDTQYTITVTNSGESTSYATNVEMMDVFPAAGSTAIFSTTGAIDSVALVSGTNRFSPSDCQFVSAPESGLKCNFAWLAPNESVAIKFTMKAMSIDNGTVPVGTILHEARVSADAEYLDGITDVSKDNTVKDRTSAYDQTQVNPSEMKLIDLSVKKTVTSPASGDSVQVGGQIAYLLTVKNEETGSKHLTGGNAVVTDVLPAGLDLVGPVPAGCTYTAATHTLECTITSLNAGASTIFAFTAKVNSVAAGQTAIANQATVKSLGDPVAANDQDEVSVPVADLDVGLTKTVNVATANPGQTITYTFTVKNLGTETANGVVVTDTLPAGVGFVASASGCTAAGSTVTCNVGIMAGSSQQVLAFTAQVNASAANGTKLNNCAKVQAVGDKNASNDESCATVTVYVPPPPEPSKPQGSIGCSVFDDADQNGTRDPGELGVAGVTIRLLNAQNQPVASTVTAADGSYSFANLTPGTYTVLQELPQGYGPTTLVKRQVEVLANQKAAACFGITTNPQTGSIGCSVFDDADENGSRGPSEKGLGGMTIRLFNNKDEELATTTTAADGNYSFPELAPGVYKVSYVLPKGYSNTSPVEHSVTVLPGQNASACFGVLPSKAKPGSVGCSVYDDANNNGERDTGEDGLPGITVRLLDASGKLLSTTTSATDGTYGFPDLPPGTYTVETDFPKGYKPTGSTSRQITVAEGANESVCFGAADGPGVLGIVKTLYEGWNTGAACGTSVAKKELLIVEKIPTEHELTWCFAVTNEGNKHLGAPVWADSEYPGMVATAKAGTTLPLAPGASGTWYFEAKHNSSVVNVVGVEMPVTDPAGKLIPDVPPASSSDDGKATFGMIYDPPYGVKVGSVDGADIINWTMVWVNDNVIAANNVYVSDTVKAPMEFVPGSLSCVGESATSVVAGTCQYAAGTKTVSVKANFAPDLGKTVANATNRLFISFKVKVPKEGGTTSYKNQGTATWTPPGETDPIDTVTVFVPGVTVDPIDPKDPKVPVVVAPPGVGVDDPSIGRPDPENSGAEVETPVVVVPDAPPPPKPPEPPKPPPTVTSIPTLSEWGVILLSCLMGLLALRQVSFARRK